MIRPLPITRDLVLLGGGHAHALVLKKWAMNPLPGASVTLIDPQVKAPYTGMLPGYVAGHYQREELDIDLVRLARQANARLIIDRAIGIDTDQKRITLFDRPTIAYDTLSIDVGIRSGLGALPGADAYLIPAKPLGPFAKAWTDALTAAAASKTALQIAVLGAGVAGVELALAMAHRLNSSGIPGSVCLIEAKPTILDEEAAGTRKKLLRELNRADIEILTGTPVTALQAGGVILGSDDEVMNADFIVSAAGAQPHAWLADTGLDLTEGYITVDKTLRSKNTPNVFAAGDCAHLSHAPRPKAGVFAVRQAPVLFANLRADLSGGALRAFQPQRSYLKLISTGRKSAVTDKWGISLSGPGIWRLKDRIDQAFMQPFRSAMAMQAPNKSAIAASGLDEVLEDHLHQCGGCGAKVAQTPLLDALSATTSEPLDDAAIVRTGDHVQVFSTDHLRAFTADPFLLAEMAAIHALGDIWSMGAKPQAVLAHIILPPLAPAKQSEMIRQIMAGAERAFQAVNVNVTGGHTSMGAELTIGFSIIGVPPVRAVGQAGAIPGDALILTKPIGTGVLLAAEMRQDVDGDDHHSALKSMRRPQDKAAEILAPVAHSMTDVTGFGLAGHLLNMLTASGVAARLDMDRIPLLSGAEAASQNGIRSTLWGANAKVMEHMKMTPSPRTDLLFDPQTCGGLLATIPQARLEQVLSDFAAAGEPIWQIGEIVAGTPHIQVE